MVRLVFSFYGSLLWRYRADSEDVWWTWRWTTHGEVERRPVSEPRSGPCRQLTSRHDERLRCRNSSGQSSRPQRTDPRRWRALRGTIVHATAAGQLSVHTMVSCYNCCAHSFRVRSTFRTCLDQSPQISLVTLWPRLTWKMMAKIECCLLISRTRLLFNWHILPGELFEVRLCIVQFLKIFIHRER